MNAGGADAARLGGGASDLDRYAGNNMTEDIISEISIDNEARLRVYPSTSTYDYIYRAACEVNWDKEGKFLYSPKPREWTYFNWFTQIVAAVKSEYGNLLIITNNTVWSKISEETESEIIVWAEKESITRR